MQTETTQRNPSVPLDRALLTVRLGRNRLALGGLALLLLTAGLIWQWNWLVAIGVAPLLLIATSCVAMCVLCMHRKGGRAYGTAPSNSPDRVTPTASREEETKT
jgi:hypothetical protein